MPNSLQPILLNHISVIRGSNRSLPSLMIFRRSAQPGLNGNNSLNKPQRVCLTPRLFPVKTNTQLKGRMKTNVLKYHLISVGVSMHGTHAVFLNGSVCVCVCLLTSLQSVFCDWATVDAQAGAGVGSHLDLVLGPDDQVLQQTVVGLWAADVLLLVVPRQTRQTVPAARTHHRGNYCNVT